MAQGSGKTPALRYEKQRQNRMADYLGGAGLGMQWPMQNRRNLTPAVWGKGHPFTPAGVVLL